MSIPVPMDDQAELSVLGSMLMSPAACSTAVQRLSPSDFYRSSHGRVFAAIRDAHEQLRDSEIVDTVMVRSLLADDADRVVLNTAPSVVPAVANASRYVDVVLDLAHRRRLAQVADQTAHAARNGGVSEEQRRSLSDMLDVTPGQARPPFPVYSAEQLRDLPSAEMLIDGLLVRGGFNVKYGATDALKTFTGIDETLTIASQTGDWHGRRTRHGVVVYCAGEGGGGLWKRVEAWCMSTGRPLPEDALFIVEPVNMFDPTKAGIFTAWLGTLPVAPVLVVFDTLSRSMVGGDESSNADMALLISNMDRIRHLYGSAVLVLHHTGHGDQSRERGASALMGAADCRIHVTRPDSEAFRVMLKVVKMKDGRRPSPIMLELAEVGQSLAVVGVSSVAETRQEDFRAAVIAFLADHPGSSQNAVENGVEGNRGAIRDALSGLVDAGVVTRCSGPHGAKLHSLARRNGSPDTTSPPRPLPKRGEVGERRGVPTPDLRLVDVRRAELEPDA